MQATATPKLFMLFMANADELFSPVKYDVLQGRAARRREAM